MTTISNITSAAQLNAAVANGELKQLHNAKRKGYVSRKGDGVVKAYEGRFGKGYVLLSPRYDTTRFVSVTYFVEA